MNPSRRSSPKKLPAAILRKNPVARSKRGAAPRTRQSPALHDDGHEPRPDGLVAAADALYRCAVEACRQHHRVARLVDAGATDMEQQTAWKCAALCDNLLREVTDAYAPAAAGASEGDAGLRRCGNALWRASRAFTNRFLENGRVRSDTRREHSSDDFLDLRLRHELDASAILSLRHAADEYAKARPGSDVQ